MTYWAIRTKLTFWYTSIFGGTLVLFGLLTYLAFSYANNKSVDVGLEEEAEGIVYCARISKDSLKDYVTCISNEKDARSSEKYIAILDEKGNLQFRSGSVTDNYMPLSSSQLKEILSGKMSFKTVKSLKGQLLRIVTIPTEDNRQLIQMGIVVTKNSVSQIFLLSIIVLGCLATIGGWFGGWFMAKKALRPVDCMIKELQKIETRHLGKRLTIHPAKDEISELSGVINAMLSRLENSFNQVRQFTTDASHELRTPIAIMKAGIEVALSRERDICNYQQVLANTLEDLGRLSKIVDNLFILAKADAGRYEIHKERMNLCPVFTDIAEQLKLIAEPKSIFVSMKNVQKSIFQWYCKLSFFWFGTHLFLVLLTTNTLCANGLTLDEVLKLGMRANPEISSLEERIEAARGAVVQAGTAPNPDANIKVEDYSPGNGTAKTTLGFTQRLEYPGKRSTRKSIASENVEILKLTLESSKLEIIYKLKKAFYDILLASENLSLYRENQAVARSLLELVNHRLKQGLGGEFEVAKANVELIKSEKLLKESEGQLALAKSQLNLLLNNPPSNRINIQGKITTYPPRTILSREELIRKAINSHPSILVQTHRIKGLEHTAALTKLLVKPDVDVGIAGGLETLGNPDSNPIAEFSVSVPMPIWDRKKGAIAQAEGEKKGAEAFLKQVQRNITQEVLDAFNKYTIAQKTVHLFHEGILEKTAKTRDIIRQSFEKGLLGFLDVVDAQRTYLDVMLNYYQSLYDLHIAETQLAKAIGGSLP